MSITVINEATKARFTPTMSKVAVNAMLNAINGVSKDAVRYALTFIRFDFDIEHGDVIMRTTNSYRAQRIRVFTNGMDNHQPFVVNADELKAALPKPSQFKSTGDEYLTITFYPGRAELDPGQLELTWGNTQRLVRADPIEGATGTMFPDIDGLFSGHATDYEKGATMTDTFWTPEFVQAIAQEIKRMDKDAKLELQLGLTELKPAIWRSQGDGWQYECLLMPVRKP